MCTSLGEKNIVTKIQQLIKNATVTEAEDAVRMQCGLQSLVRVSAVFVCVKQFDSTTDLHFLHGFRDRILISVVSTIRRHSLPLSVWPTPLSRVTPALSQAVSRQHAQWSLRDSVWFVELVEIHFHSSGSAWQVAHRVQQGRKSVGVAMHE